MPDQYAGSGSTFSATTTILSTDANGVVDKCDAAVYQPFFKSLADQQAYLAARMPLTYVAQYDTWTTAGNATSEADGKLLDVPGCLVGDQIHIRIGFSTSRGTGSFDHAYGALIEDKFGTPVTTSAGIGLGPFVTGNNEFNEPPGLLGTLFPIAHAGTLRICFGTTVLSAVTAILQLSFHATRYPA